MDVRRTLRFLAPNLLTGASVLFGLTSLAAAHAGNWPLAGWMIIYAVLSDRLDGLVARYLKATSVLGMQLDSLADFLNFGVAPGFLVYCFLTSQPELQFSSGGGLWLLRAVVALWVCAAGFRLGRYNATSDEDVPTKIFFGVPTTLAGGLVAIWFLFLLKYGGGDFGGARLFGSWQTPFGLWAALPAVMAIFAYLMVSSHPMPKYGLWHGVTWKVFVAINLLVGYVCGLAQLYPELLVVPPTVWILGFLLWGQLSAEARNLRQPPLFPSREDASISVRHQEDIATPDDYVDP